MADYRSKSCSDGKMQIQPYDFRSYSVSYTSSSSSSSTSTHRYAAAQPPPPPPPQKLKKGRSTNSGSSISKTWSLNDPEFQRKTRVAGYKVYSVQGRVKGSFRKSFRWLKDTYSQVVYGRW
ncbi:hypothetical protein ABFS83_01G011000 [Erythranthe nasuta]